jgi:hypothetical protein
VDIAVDFAPKCAVAALGSIEVLDDYDAGLGSFGDVGVVAEGNFSRLRPSAFIRVGGTYGGGSCDADHGGKLGAGTDEGLCSIAEAASGRGTSSRALHTVGVSIRRSAARKSSVISGIEFLPLHRYFWVVIRSYQFHNGRQDGRGEGPVE